MYHIIIVVVLRSNILISLNVLSSVKNMQTLAERNYLAFALSVNTLGEKPQIELFLRRSCDKILPRATFSATIN